MTVAELLSIKARGIFVDDGQVIFHGDLIALDGMTGRSHVGTDQNVMSVISDKNGMTGRNMMGAERGGKRQASVTFAAMM